MLLFGTQKAETKRLLDISEEEAPEVGMVCYKMNLDWRFHDAQWNTRMALARRWNRND